MRGGRGFFGAVEVGARLPLAEAVPFAFFLFRLRDGEEAGGLAVVHRFVDGAGIERERPRRGIVSGGVVILDLVQLVDGEDGDRDEASAGWLGRRSVKLYQRDR